MTKFIDWINMKLMSSREKSGINTATTFSEQREKKEKTIGIGKKDENKAK